MKQLSYRLCGRATFHLAFFTFHSPCREPPSIPYQPTGVIRQLRETAQRFYLVAIATEKSGAQSFFRICISALKTVNDRNRSDETGRPRLILAFDDKKPTDASARVFRGMLPTMRYG